MMAMYTLSGGKTDLSMSIGFANINFSRVEFSTFSGSNAWYENMGYGLGALANLGDIANVVDNFTHWEDKLAAKSKAYMEDWVSKHPDAVVDPHSVGKNAGRSYPSYLGENPKILGTNTDYMGMVDNWGWKEYPGYLHDIEYIKKGILDGAKYLVFSHKTMGADIRLMARTLYLGLKHNSPFELLTGSMITGLNV